MIWVVDYGAQEARCSARLPEDRRCGYQRTPVSGLQRPGAQHARASGLIGPRVLIASEPTG